MLIRAALEPRSDMAAELEAPGSMDDGVSATALSDGRSAPPFTFCMEHNSGMIRGWTY